MRPSLTKLVAQIGEIIGQSGEDSHSGTTQSQSDGGLRTRLRTVLLSLLDGIMGDGGASGKGVVGRVGVQYHDEHTFVMRFPLVPTKALLLPTTRCLQPHRRARRSPPC